MTFNRWASKHPQIDRLLLFPLEAIWNAVVNRDSSPAEAARLFDDLIKDLDQHVVDAIDDALDDQSDYSDRRMRATMAEIDREEEYLNLKGLLASS